METEFIRPDSPLDGSAHSGESNGEAKKARQPTMAGPAEGANIVDILGAKEIEKLSAAVISDFDADVKSRSGRMKKCKEFTELYAGLLKPKAFPWRNCANVNLNVLSYTSLQVHARLFDMIWPDNGKIIYSAPSTVDDFQRAAITEKFANSYIRNKMPEMAQGLDDTLAQLVIYGSAFRRTYWDSYEGRVRSDWIPIEDFVVAHEFRSQDPSMRDVPRYTMVYHPTLWELKMHADRGVYSNVKGIEAEQPETPTSEMRDAVKKIDGTDPASDGSEQDKPRMVLEQHRVWMLPNRPGVHPAFDGKPHYVAITLDKQSRRVLRVVLREETDPDDLKRYVKERAESGYDEYLIKRQAYEETIVAAQQQAIQGGNALLPEAPIEVLEPVKPRQRQISFFTHYRAFPSEGFYGLGFGDFIGPLNRAANTLLNQHIDGVSVRNARPGFISRQMRMQRGSVNVAPGELVEVDAPAAAIRDGIVWLDPPLNDPTTMPLVNLLISMADKFAGSSDIMSGATSGANRTAKEIQILNAQLMKQISVLAKRVREALKHEFDKVWRLWGTFLPDEPEPTDIIDPLSGAPDRLPISRKMFVPDARIFPAADPRLRFEKVEETMQSAGVVMNTPMLAQNPAIVRAVVEEVLKAHGKEELIAMLGPPPGPPEPPTAKPHWEEEAAWLEDRDSPVHPDDDDTEHTQMHLAFLSSPRAQMMSKVGRDMAERHVRFHEAQALRKTATQMQQMGGPPGMPPGPPMGGMIGPPQVP